MVDLAASASLRGRAIDLALAWEDPGTQARSLRLLRRRLAYPTSPDDGLVVVDLTELFTPAGAPWGFIDRLRFLVLNAPAEGGLLQAEIASYYQVAGDAAPARVRVLIYDTGADAVSTSSFDGVTQVVSTASASATFAAVTTLQILAPALVGTVVISTQATDGVTPDRLDWTPVGGGTTSASFTLQEEQHTTSALGPAVAPGLNVELDTGVASATPGAPDISIRTVVFTEGQNPDTGELSRTLTISDRDPPVRAAAGFRAGLHPGATYYYAAWEEVGTSYAVAPDATALSVATGHHGFSERLFALLPAIHRYYDDPASGAQPGIVQAPSWQLRRFLQVLGPGLDQAWSLGEALRPLHDLFTARADYLPYLGNWIGWPLDLTIPTERQRIDLLYAPEVYTTVGTIPNIEGLVHRSIGWTCQVKEFVNNVFRTNFVEDIRLWEIWQAPPALGTFTVPIVQTPLTVALNDSADGRPAVVAEPLGGSPWLFWHTTRPDPSWPPPSTRRQIWMQRLDGTTSAQPVMLGAPDDGPDLTYSDEWPAAIVDGGVVRLFWSSNRGGSSGIWTRTLTGGVPGVATQLTNHPAGDYSPAVVRYAGTLWLFFHSSRRGTTTDIWAMQLLPGDTRWTFPVRVTSGAPRDQMPAPFVDAGNQLNLLWSADYGDHSRIVQSTLSGSTWSTPPAPVSSGTGLYRDEAPAVALFNGAVWAFWSSDQDGIFRLYATPATGPGTWNPAASKVTQGRHAERDAATFIDGTGALRLLFSTQQSGEQYRSRTVDFSDLGAIQTGLFTDRWHYTYSVAADPNNPDPLPWGTYPPGPYARDTVGIYITPGSEESLADAVRVQALVEPFRPAPVRFAWFVQPAVTVEPVYSPIDIGESYLDSADFLGPVGETYSVALPQWSLFYTNTLGDVSANPADLTSLRHRVFYPAPT